MSDGSNLIVIKFEDQDHANEAMKVFDNLQTEHLIDLEDVAMVIRNKKGKVKIRQTADITGGRGAVLGGLWGVLIGLIFWAPVAVGLMGAALGALWGSMTDLGISDEFMKKVGTEIKPGNVAIFALIRRATFDKAVKELSHLDGELYYTSLSSEQEKKLRDKLESASKGKASKK